MRLLRNIDWFPVACVAIWAVGAVLSLAYISHAAEASVHPVQDYILGGCIPDSFSPIQIGLAVCGLLLAVAGAIALVVWLYRAGVAMSEASHSADYAAKHSLRGKIV